MTQQPPKTHTTAAAAAAVVAAAEGKGAAAPPCTQGSLVLPSNGATQPLPPAAAAWPPALPSAPGRRLQRSASLGEGGSGDAEDPTLCRTSSAYILLQLRDVGRSASSPDGVVNTNATTHGTFSSSASPAVAVPSTSSSNAATAQRQYHQQDGRAVLTRGGGGAGAGAGGGGGGGSRFDMNMSVRQQQQPPATTAAGFGPSPTTGIMGAATAAAAAIERGMYVAGLLPGFQDTSAATVASTAQPPLPPQPSPQPQQTAVSLSVGAGGTAGAAAATVGLRPICPKRSPDTVMVTSPRTGQLVPVRIRYKTLVCVVTFEIFLLHTGAV